MSTRTADLNRLKAIAESLACFVAPRDANYKGSWKRRGGIGAYFTIVRPMDRFHALAERGLTDPIPVPQKHELVGSPYDIFAIWEAEDAAGRLYHDGTLSACVKDLAAYMLLIMEEMEARTKAYHQSHDAPPFALGVTPVDVKVDAAGKLVSISAATTGGAAMPASEQLINSLEKLDKEFKELTESKQYAENRKRNHEQAENNPPNDWLIQHLRNLYFQATNEVRCLREQLGKEALDRGAEVRRLQGVEQHLQELLGNQAKLIQDLRVRIAELESKYSPSYEQVARSG